MVQVKDAMVGKDKVFTVKPSALMSDAAQMMLHNDVSAAAVPQDLRSVHAAAVAVAAAA